MTADSDAIRRLQAAGFAPGEVRRALLALAGATVPSARRQRAWREVETAAALLGEGCAGVEVVEALRQRYGISRVTAYRRIWAAVSLSAPSETDGRDTSASQPQCRGTP